MKRMQAIILLFVCLAAALPAAAAERKLQAKTESLRKQFIMIRAEEGVQAEKTFELWELNAVINRMNEDSLQSLVLLAVGFSWDEVTTVSPWFHKPVALPTDKGDGRYKVELNGREGYTSLELLVHFAPGHTGILEISGKLYPDAAGKPPVLYEVDRSLSPMKVPPIANPLR
ncbi:MAG: hypothetical protein OHK006_02950 [Thermodesulfovibrionales bacterium]